MQQSAESVYQKALMLSCSTKLQQRDIVKKTDKHCVSKDRVLKNIKCVQPIDGVQSESTDQLVVFPPPE